MDEFVIVIYPEDRDVMVDGEHTAQTNQKFILETGNHMFSLGGADDHEPDSQTLLVEGTTARKPLKVEFTPKLVAASPADRTVG